MHPFVRRLPSLAVRSVNVVVALALVVCGAGPLLAQDAEQALVGQRVRLTTEGKNRNKRLVGDLLEANDQTMRLGLEAGDEVAVPRATVVRIERSRSRSSRGEGTAVGFLVGVVVGAAVGYAAGSNCRGDEFLCFDRRETMPMAGLGLGLIGAGIGALAGHDERWEAIPEHRLRLGVAPAPGRGVIARLSLSF